MIFQPLMLFILSASSIPELPSNMSSKAIVAAHTADKELNCGHQEEAIRILEKILARNSFKRLNAEAKFPIYMRLIAAYKDQEKKQNLLEQLIQDSAFSHYTFALQIDLANLFITQKKYIEAERIAKLLYHNNISTLEPNEKELLSTLYDTLDKEYLQLETTGISLLQEKKFSEAEILYNKLWYLFRHHAFPRNAAKTTCAATEITLRYCLGHIYFHLNQFEKAHGFLEKVVQIFPPENALKIKHEALFLLARTKVALGQCNLAIQILNELSSNETTHTASTLYTLAMLHIQQKNYTEAKIELSKLLQCFPEYIYNDEALYMLISLEEKDPLVKNSREKIEELVTRYPNSTKAPQCMLRLFSENEYALGTPNAIRNLEELVERYENSPYSIIAHYFIALHKQKKDPLHKEHFQKAVSLYEQTSTTIYKHVYLLSLRALAKAKDIQSATTLISVLENEQNSAPENKELNYLYAESLYLFATIYIDQNENARAIRELRKLIYWHEAHAYTSPFLAQAHLAIAKEAYEKGLFEAALDDLIAAEKVATDELLLDVKVTQGECLIQLKRYDEAMLILSKVVNENIASQMRIKAMLLRSEIYEQQGRYDLAIKQLASASKKGGEWAKKAKEKLGSSYGYQ